MRRHVEFDRLHNFRDLGGYPTLDGRIVRSGRLYRADSLAKLEGGDWDRFCDLGIRTVIDLRYGWEITAKGRVPDYDGLAYYNFSIEHRPYDQPSLDPSIEPGRFLADRYAEVANDGVKEIRQTLEVLASPAAMPTVVHCTSGKDRTGLIAALVLTVLGVGEDHIITDFALTEHATDRLLADWRRDNPDREPVWPGYGRAPAEVMQLFLADLSSTYGSVRGYIDEQLQLDEDVIRSFRQHMLPEPSPAAHPTT